MLSSNNETHVQQGEWLECIEAAIRPVVKLLRDNGFNTFCSCEHDGFVQMEWYDDAEVTRLYTLLSENGYDGAFEIVATWTARPTWARRFIEVTFANIKVPR